MFRKCTYFQRFIFYYSLCLFVCQFLVILCIKYRHTYKSWSYRIPLNNAKTFLMETNQLSVFHCPDYFDIVQREFQTFETVFSLFSKIINYIIIINKLSPTMFPKIVRFLAMPFSLAKGNKLPGFEVIRGCTSEQENVIKRQYSKIQNQLSQKSENIVLYNVFRDGKFSTQDGGIYELHSWVKKLIQEIEPGAGCFPVVETFILNPKDNQVTQDYHMDFAQHMRTLFINMDYLTSLNSPQFIKEPLQQHTRLSLRGAKQFGSNERDMLMRENRQWIEVSQMICRPFTIMLCKSGTVHRGIANRSGVNRAVFSVCYTDLKGYESGEPKIGTQKYDIE